MWRRCLKDINWAMSGSIYMGISNPHKQLIKICMYNKVNHEIAAVHVNVVDNTITSRAATIFASVFIMNHFCKKKKKLKEL